MVETITKTTTESKLLKLAKRLHKFTFDEFLVTAEDNEENIKNFLNDCIFTGKIKKIDEDAYICRQTEYMERKKLVKISRKFISFSPEEIQKLREERNTLDPFKNAPKFIQKMINKYIDLLAEVGNMKGKSLDGYINNIWNEEHPDMETSQPAFYRAKRKLKTYGVAGLIPPGKSFLSACHQLDEFLYREFRDYILNNKGRSLRYNYTKFCGEYLKQNPETLKREFPSYGSFVTRIKNDILVFKDSELANIYDEKKKVEITKKKIGFNTFQSAAQDFLNDIINSNEFKKDALTRYKSYINVNMIPFFGNTKLREIDDNKLEQFEMLLKEQLLSSNTIRSQINIVRKILKIYMDNTCPPSEIKKIAMEYENKINVLDRKQVQKLLTVCKEEFPNFYPLLVTAVNTGLTRGEILSLTWDKVDWENKRIKINRSMYNGEIIILKAKRAVRDVELPDEIMEILLELKNVSKSNFVFPDNSGNFQNPDDMINNKFKPLAEKAGLENIKFIDLRDSYIALLLSQNISFSYVKDQVGYSNLNNLEAQFKKYIPQQKKNFCLI